MGLPSWKSETGLRETRGRTQRIWSVGKQVISRGILEPKSGPFHISLMRSCGELSSPAGCAPCFSYSSGTRFRVDSIHISRHLYQLLRQWCTAHQHPPQITHLQMRRQRPFAPWWRQLPPLSNFYSDRKWLWNSIASKKYRGGAINKSICHAKQPT